MGPFGLNVEGNEGPCEGWALMLVMIPLKPEMRPIMSDLRLLVPRRAASEIKTDRVWAP